MKSNIVMVTAIAAAQLLIASGALAAAAQPDASRVAKPHAAASATASAGKKGPTQRQAGGHQQRFEG